MAKKNGTKAETTATVETQPVVETKTETKPSFVKLALAAWLAPGPFLKMFRAANPQFPIVVGSVLAWEEMGLPAHPQFGVCPPLTVTFIHPSGAVEGTIKCVDCGEIVEVHAGDIFQKRRCETHQRKMQHLSRKGIKSPEEAEQRKAEREAKRLQEQAEKATKKAASIQAQAEKTLADAQAKVKAAQERAALIAKTAKDMGVAISPKAEEKAEVAA